jgi:hypothetical protein
MRTAILAIIACCGLAACQTAYTPASFDLAKQRAGLSQTDHTRTAEPGEMVSDARGATGIDGPRLA